MSEQKKDECCNTPNSGCGCCGGVKKLIFLAVLSLIVFTCGYIMGKGHCPFSSSSCSGKICPLTASK